MLKMETRMKNPSCEVIMNDFETKIYVMEKENHSFQTQGNVVSKDEVIKLHLQKVNGSKKSMERMEHKCIVLGFLLCE
jgi:hypothetical protein